MKIVDFLCRNVFMTLFGLMVQCRYFECIQHSELLPLDITEKNFFFNQQKINYENNFHIKNENENQIDSSIKSLQALDSLINAIKLKPNSIINQNLEEENGELFSSTPVSKKIIYWKVTENGYSYCSVNCLFGNIRNISFKKNFEIEKTNELINELKFNQNYEKSPSHYPSKNYSIDSEVNNIENITQTDQLTNVETKINFLECMPYANNTQYDSLKSILKRSKLKSKPDPELITMFDRTGRIEISDLKQKLIEMKHQNISEVVLYNRIGNFYRIVGDAYQSIECFRKALQFEPHNSDVLINTARLLYKLKHYEDSIFLVKKSLEYIRPNRLPWLQHFTFGEILKENGYYEEAFLHLQYVLKLKPGYANAVKLLKEINQLIDDQHKPEKRNILLNYIPSSIINYFTSLPSTVCIQLSFHFLILFVLILIGVVYMVLESSSDEASTNLKFSTDSYSNCESNVVQNNINNNNKRKQHRVCPKIKKF